MTDHQRVQLQPAYVIHQRPYRDTSALVEVFSENHGRCTLVAKGVKRPKSKIRGLLQPFQPLLLSWVSRSELGTLTDAELFARPVMLKSRYLASAFYLNELIHYFLHRNDPHDELFNRYHTTLGQLHRLTGTREDDLMWQVILRRFELELLQSIGYGLVLDHDVKTRSPVAAGSFYDYQLGHGPVRILDEHDEQQGIRISGVTLLDLMDDRRLLAKIQQPDEALLQILREAKRLLRSVIDYHLGPKTLHSRQLVTGLSRPSPELEG
ncbi:MAG: DNA repair protein RecO [Gammaproteobacteria bacterium]|jgi:DNA repair protein RecO (recombination protein O)